MTEQRTEQRIEAVDLFCGVGGLSYGLSCANIRVAAGIDIDPACKYPYEENTGAAFIEADVSSLTGVDVSRLFGKKMVRLLAGCAPCQPFSTLSHTNSKDDKQCSMLLHFARLVRDVAPELVTMENVPRVMRHSPYKEFVRTLEEMGYAVDAKRVRCADFGIPQERRRLVLVASRIGEVEFDVPAKVTSPISTVRSAIGQLRPLSAGETDPNDPVHKARNLSPLNLQRIRASRPGGTWRDWPEELRAPCHQRDSGSSYGGVYSRMEWDSPSPTITTQSHNFGTGRFGHPDQDRAISLREAALLQSFPENYRFTRPREAAPLTTLGRLIGNAVPPKLGKAIGQSLISHVSSS